MDETTSNNITASVCKCTVRSIPLGTNKGELTVVAGSVHRKGRANVHHNAFALYTVAQSQDNPITPSTTLEFSN